MRIALLGTRGIPASYGGFETFAEELATRLAARGHEVTVYCRAHHTPRALRAHRGVRLVVLPTIRRKHLDTPVHTLLSVLHAAAGGYQAVVMCNAANAVFVPLCRLAGQRVALNVDGLEWKRRKWGMAGRWCYLLSERLAAVLADAVVTDSRVVEEYYRTRHRAGSSFIPYGAAEQKAAGTASLERLGLQPRRYLLYVSRLEPENNADRVVREYAQVRTEVPLVVVGDAPYARAYIERLHATADPRVRFTGYQFGEPYRELMSHALACVHATEAGGTHPALLDAMGIGNGVLVNDVAENREVAQDAAVYFRCDRPGDLAEKLKWVLDDPERLAPLAERARARARAAYRWEAVADGYEGLLRRMLESRATASWRNAAS
jgi:glycosyltransferase involved in cell wall biosynthesis